MSKKLMNSTTVMNASVMLERLQNGEQDIVIQELQEIHTKDSRWLVMSDKEVLEMTASLLKGAANKKSSLNDKLLGIMFIHSASILEKHGIINI